MLRIKFWRIENTIVMKILEQGEEIERRCRRVFEHDGITIASIDKPGLIRETIYLRGSMSDWDLDACCACFPTADEAKEYMGKYITAIKAYNASLGKTDSKDDIEGVIAE